MALWISPAVIPRFEREDVGDVDCMFSGGGMPDARIEERRFGTMEGEACGESTGIVNYNGKREVLGLQPTMQGNRLEVVREAVVFETI